MINKEAFNWYGFDHAVVRKHYGDLDGNLEYVGSFCIKGSYSPYAVYYAPNPDRSKGHMNYVLFKRDAINHTFYVSGMTHEEIVSELTQAGIRCLKCAEVIYSVNRHDFRYCGCRATFVDGGRDYVRSNNFGECVTIDLRTGLVT
jgi:hypothetical protein